MKGDTVVQLKPESDFRVTDGEQDHHLFDVVFFGCRGFEKLFSCRSIVKQIAHFDHSSGGSAGRPDRNGTIRHTGDLHSGISLFFSGAQGKSAYRCNGRDGFSAET